MTFRLPRSLLPVIHKAEEKMRTLVHEVRTGAYPAAIQAPLLSPMFPPSADQIITMAAAPLQNHPRGPSISAHIKVAPAKQLERFLPDSFPGPARRETNNRLLEQKDAYAVHHLLTPLVGDESSAFDMSRKYVYRVATIAGLWQFRGLDDDIDEALNIVWQGGHSRTCDTRASESLTSSPRS